MDRPLNDLLSSADEATGRVSELVRNLALGAIAVVWIFKNPDKEVMLLPSKLLSWALFFAVSGLAVDLCHYVFRAITLTKFFRLKEKEFDDGNLTEEQAQDIHTPDYIIKWSDRFWWVKISLVIIAYTLISVFLIGRLP
jgi:hypothetical protein